MNNFGERIGVRRSGHSTFSKASAQVLTRFYGTDAIAFSVGSNSLPGVFRAFTSLAGCADEIGMSRIYAGTHFQFSNRDGKTCGRRIGDYVTANFLLPNNRLPLLVPDGASTNHVPVFRLHGHIGATCVLDASTDLVHWQSISTNLAVCGGLPVVDVAPMTSAIRFYRAREE
jgi:hypothetical protein